MWGSIKVILLRVLYECLPRTLRTPLNSPYHPVHSKRVKHFEPLGL